MNYGFMSVLNALRSASSPDEARRAIDAAEKLPLSDYERGLACRRLSRGNRSLSAMFVMSKPEESSK
jgi:hypothetical protein